MSKRHITARLDTHVGPMLFVMEDETSVTVRSLPGHAWQGAEFDFYARLGAVEGWEAIYAEVAPVPRRYDAVMSAQTESARHAWLDWLGEDEGRVGFEWLALAALTGAQNRRDEAHDRLAVAPNDLAAHRALFIAEDEERELSRVQTRGRHAA